MLLHGAFEETTQRLPEKLALICGQERLTYRDLGTRVNALAALLLDRGVRRGDRVAIFLESSSEFAAAVHAALRIGAVFVPISAQTKVDKLSHILRDTRAHALLTHASLVGVWADAMVRGARVQVCVVQGNVERDGSVLAWPQPDDIEASTAPGVIDQDLAAIIYTSGTTGLPKGVMLSHLNMCSAWSSVQAYLGLREDDVIGLALPPAFSYGLYYLLMGLGVGATVMLERTVAFPVKMVERFAHERVTVFPGVPTLFSAITGLTTLSTLDFSALRIVTSAAAALPDEHVRTLRRLWPHVRLYSMYGLTECKRVSYLPHEQIDIRPASVGRGMQNQDIWLVDGEGRRLPNGSTGELVVRGSHVMRGYWNRPAETVERLRPGPIPGEMVLHTGDIFRTDSEGWLYFVARSDDIIKSRGEKVAPREVENAIYALPGVLDCAVVGVPDEAMGEAIKAFVTLRPGATLTERDVVRHCMARVESYMAPRIVEFVAELPRTDSGKIRKVDLR
jgi:long-chain acyl-CoA synthetase